MIEGGARKSVSEDGGTVGVLNVGPKLRPCPNAPCPTPLHSLALVHCHLGRPVIQDIVSVQEKPEIYFYFISP